MIIVNDNDDIVRWWWS